MSEKEDLNIIRRYPAEDRQGILQAVCAFANSASPEPKFAAVAVLDNGEPLAPGTRLAQRRANELAERLRDLFTLIVPPYQPELFIRGVEGIQTILIRAVPGVEQPYICPSDPAQPEADYQSFMISEEESGEDKPAAGTEEAPAEGKAEAAAESAGAADEIIAEPGEASPAAAEAEPAKEEEPPVPEAAEIKPETAAEEAPKIVFEPGIETSAGEEMPAKEEEPPVPEAAGIEPETEEVPGPAAKEASEETAEIIAEPAKASPAAAEAAKEPESSETIPVPEIIEKPEAPAEMAPETAAAETEAVKELITQIEPQENLANKETAAPPEAPNETEPAEEIPPMTKVIVTSEGIREEPAEDKFFALDPDEASQGQEKKVPELPEEDHTVGPEPDSQVSMKTIIEELLADPEKSEPEPEAKEEPAEPFEETETVLTDRRSRGYARIKHFVGGDEEQRQAVLAYLTNNILESRIFPPHPEEVPDYDIRTIRGMLGEAYRYAKGRIDIETAPKRLTVSFVSAEDQDLEYGDWDVESDGDKTVFVLDINPQFLNGFDEAPSARRHSPEEIREKALQALEEGPCSTNVLAKRMGYKGISKTLSRVIEALIREGKIQYTNPNMRGSNQKLQKI